MNVIETHNLCKYFGKILAVKDLNIRIKEGEIFGLLGPNGAGKTTIISILTTLLLPTKGVAKVNGFNIIKEPKKIRASIGVVFQNSVLDDELTVLDNLNFYAGLYKIKDKTRIKEILDLLGLSNNEKTKVENLSFGMKRKLEIGKSLLHYPKVLFLDEPTLGIDPKTRRKVWDYILDLNKNKKMTIFLATNYMEEAEFLCKRIGIINNGEMLFLGKKEKLQSKFKSLEELFLHHIEV